MTLRYSVAPVLEASFCALHSLRTFRCAVRVQIYRPPSSIATQKGLRRRMAEGERFELSIELPLYCISSAAH